MLQKITLLAIALIGFASCTKKESVSDNSTAWNIGGKNFQGASTMRTDNALMIRNNDNTSYLYARFAEGQIQSGTYKVVEGIPANANEISFSVNRNGQDYISTASGSPSATVTYVNNHLNILISNVWMLHLPFRQDSLLLDAVMIEQ